MAVEILVRRRLDPHAAVLLGIDHDRHVFRHTADKRMRSIDARVDHGDSNASTGSVAVGPVPSDRVIEAEFGARCEIVAVEDLRPGRKVERPSDAHDSNASSTAVTMAVALGAILGPQRAEASCTVEVRTVGRRR